ncbi:MliC family protein [Pantoea sp. BAV 3049]|uniref:MliC family protein n=1 Tax=Pantoea sp. BAV 3049 TaxID=2654188 RepID=UPI00131AC15E|nr:MliC family protein [Pantoea sp. BAV 3049]
MKKIVIASSLVLLSGCSMFHSEPEKPKTLHYTCGTLPLTVIQDNSRQEVNLILDGNPLTLKQQEAASGTRYSDGNYVFWSKGDGAFIERNGKLIVNDCRLTAG